MISFDNFIMEEGIPIYLQIVRHIKRGIASGEIKNRDEMPSRRVLSALLGVNPNTVQKAYHMLEEEELIESRAGAGSCIVADPEKKLLLRAQLIEGEIGTLVAALKKTGIGADEAIELVRRLWDKE